MRPASRRNPRTWPWRCWPTMRSCMSRARRASDRSPLAEFYLLPQDRPDRETVLAAGRSHHPCHPAAADPPASVRPISSSATAPPTSSRSSRPPLPLRVADGVIAGACFALGGVGTRPWRVPEAEEVLVGQAPSDGAVPAGGRYRAAGRATPEPERLQGRACETLHRGGAYAGHQLITPESTICPNSQPHDRLSARNTRASTAP